MRKILLFVWACMGLVCLMSACKTSVKSKEWKLVWVEDFDQKNSFDESVWTKIPRGTSDWNNYMSYYDSCYAMPLPFCYVPKFSTHGLSTSHSLWFSQHLT